MSSDPNNPEILTSVTSDIEAAAIVTALREHSIQASTTGGFTANFLAESPGWVHVIVRQKDLAPARQILADFASRKSPVDWSQIDVGEAEES